MINVLVDTLGGDNSPLANVEGAIMALGKISDICITLVGDEQKINEIIKDKSFDQTRLKIVNAPDEISCNDKPTEAIMSKKDSSLYKCFELLKSSEEINAMISTGSTGAILAGAVLRIGRIKGVKRPAFCPILPTMTGGIVSICDCGANSDCDQINLNQFAIMGDLYLKCAYNIQSPRVALLNIGTEEEKGDILRKAVYNDLKNNKDINFIGNMEGRDLFSGKCDLVVSDGFSGNILLKSSEGAFLEAIKLFKTTFYKNLKTKLCALFLKKDLKSIKAKVDYNNYGGAVLLGTKKTIVKGHGSSKSTAVFHCIEQAYSMEKNNLREKIESVISSATDNY